MLGKLLSADYARPVSSQSLPDLVLSPPVPAAEIEQRFERGRPFSSGK